MTNIWFTGKTERISGNSQSLKENMSPCTLDKKKACKLESIAYDDCDKWHTETVFECLQHNSI